LAIDIKDIKLLWGKAAGRCSYPNCQDDLAPLLASNGATILGEMAHIIGRKSGAARSDVNVGADDTYSNLILLCPTHHTLIDKAEGDFSIDLLQSWKSRWEGQVAASFPQISDRAGLFREIQSLLEQNHQIHSEWGPTSQRAKDHPQSSQSAAYWQLRRIGVILPNNGSILNLLRANKQLFTPTEWSIATSFIEHAEFFARHCIEPCDSTAYLPFPEEFSNLIFRERTDG